MAGDLEGLFKADGSALVALAPHRR